MFSPIYICTDSDIPYNASYKKALFINFRLCPNLNRHHPWARTSPVDVATRTTCDLCGKSFANKSSLNRLVSTKFLVYRYSIVMGDVKIN